MAASSADTAGTGAAATTKTELNLRFSFHKASVKHLGLECAAELTGIMAPSGGKPGMELLGPSPSRLKLEQTQSRSERIASSTDGQIRSKEENLLGILQRFGDLGVNSDAVDEQRFGFGEEFHQTGHLLREKQTPLVLMREP